MVFNCNRYIEPNLYKYLDSTNHFLQLKRYNNITVTANGKSTTKSYTVYQQANAVTDYNYSPYSYYASCSIGDGLTAGGGSASVTASAGHNSYYLYTSGSYDGGGHHHSDGVTTAMIVNGNNRFSYSNGTITHSSMGTTATTDTVTIRATNSTNGSTADASKSVVNQVTNDNYSPYSYSASVSVGNGISAAGGSATVTASAGHRHVYYYYYTSTSTSGPYYSYPGDTVTTAMVSNGNSRFSYNTSTKVITHSNMTTNATTDTVTIRATNSANTSVTGDGSKSIVNSVSYTFSTPVVTVPSNQSVSSSAGEFALTDANTTAKQDYTTAYTSGSIGSGTDTYHIYNLHVTSNNANFRILQDGQSQKVAWDANTGQTSRSATITATLTAYGKSGSSSFTITQSSPAPVTASFTIINNLHSDTFGTWTISAAGHGISGDITAGAVEEYEWPSSVFPFTVTKWSNGILDPNDYSQWQIACSSDNYSSKIYIKKNGFGTYDYTRGSITVTEGSTIRMDVW